MVERLKEKKNILKEYKMKIIHGVPIFSAFVPNFIGHFKKEMGIDEGAREIKLLEREEALFEAIQFYPIDFFHRNGIRKVYLCQHNSGSTGSYHPATGTILVKYIDSNLARKTFHHEINHALVVFRFGNLVPEWKKLFVMEDSITVLLMKLLGQHIEKTYKQPGYIGRRYKRLEVSTPGFASKYARHSILEDIAETTRMLINPRKVALVISNENTSDPFPGEVISLKKTKILMNFYYLKSGGKMDEKFWNDLAAGMKIDYNYWEKRDAENNYGPAPRNFKEAKLKF